MSKTKLTEGFDIEPIEFPSPDKQQAISDQLWHSLGDNQAWLVDEMVDVLEVRTGPGWMCRVFRKIENPISFREAIFELAYYPSFRAGLLRLKSGGRVFFNISDHPALTVRLIELPVDGKKLQPAFTCEIYPPKGS